MSESSRPNAFQTDMAAALKDLASDGGATCYSKFVDGVAESYYVLALVGADQIPLRVYLYLDEVGYYAGEDWHIHERSDFATPEQLKRSVLTALRKRLGLRS